MVILYIEECSNCGYGISDGEYAVKLPNGEIWCMDCIEEQKFEVEEVEITND